MFELGSMLESVLRPGTPAPSHRSGADGCAPSFCQDRIYVTFPHTEQVHAGAHAADQQRGIRGGLVSTNPGAQPRHRAALSPTFGGGTDT